MVTAEVTEDHAEAAEDSLRSSAKASAISAVELFPQLATTPSRISTS
jgi:hypothetical protein